MKFLAANKLSPLHAKEHVQNENNAVCIDLFRPGPSCIRTVHRYLLICRIFNGIFICLFDAVFSSKL